MKHKITIEQLEYIKNRYQSFCSIRDLASELNFNEETIRRALRKIGFTARWSKQEKESKVLQAYKNGKTTQQTGEEFNISYKRVLQILHKNNIKIRESRGGANHNYSNQPRANESYQWKGGKKIDPKGYVLIINPNRFDKTQPYYLREHRLIMENYLGRKLEKNEHVHHINGIKNDNRLDNLIIKKSIEHYGEVVCPCCKHHFRVR